MKGSNDQEPRSPRGSHKPSNQAASVRARLLTLARSRGENFDFLLNRYASERLLYRLSQSPQASTFILKGATLFSLWSRTPHRATRDLDLLGAGDPVATNHVTVIKGPSSSSGSRGDASRR